MSEGKDYSKVELINSPFSDSIDRQEWTNATKELVTKIRLQGYQMGFQDGVKSLSDQLRKREEEAFNAGRDTDKPCGVPFLDAMTYRTFEDCEEARGRK